MTQFLLLCGTLPVFAVILMTALLAPARTAFTRKKIMALLLLFVLTLLLNAFVFNYFGCELYRKYYMLLVQVPVFTGFYIISEHRGIKLLFTLFTTVALCSLPVEFVVAARILTNGNPVAMASAVLLAYTLVLLFTIFFLRPRYLFTLKFGEPALFWKFILVPVLYYLYCYLYSGYNFMRIQTLNGYFVNRIPELMMLVFYLILPDIFKTICEKTFLEKRRDFMQMQLSSATDQIEQLRKAQQQTEIYRHDLRHHMHYLNSCLVENRTEDASAYIHQIFEKIDHLQVTRYCTNESVNLILTSYADKAAAQGISMDIRVTGVDFSRFQIMDICSLLSNALENALKASAQSETKRFVSLHMFEKNTSLCIRQSNSFGQKPVFKNGVPVSFREGHGIGIKSMLYVIGKYQGIYKFSVENEQFLFQLSM